MKNIRYETQVLFPTPAFVQILVLMKRSFILGSVGAATSLLTGHILLWHIDLGCGSEVHAELGES